MGAAAFGLLALLIGVVAGLRAITPFMIVSWAACLKWIDLQHTWASFLGHGLIAAVLTALAIGELINDQRPSTPSRKAPPSFAFRLFSGAFCAAALAAGVQASGMLGIVCGVVGAVIGTLGGYELRTRLVRTLKVPDLAIALPEDLVAVGGGFLVVALFLH